MHGEPVIDQYKEEARRELRALFIFGAHPEYTLFILPGSALGKNQVMKFLPCRKVLPRAS